jgi:hypothetical protein
MRPLCSHIQAQCVSQLREVSAVLLLDTTKIRPSLVLCQYYVILMSVDYQTRCENQRNNTLSKILHVFLVLGRELFFPTINGIGVKTIRLH